jgi:Glycosyl hydrolases family 25
LFWQESVAADFGSYPLWLAYYATEPEVPATWRAWTFWQHTDAGEVPGIAGQVDLNYCALSEEDLAESERSLKPRPLAPMPDTPRRPSSSAMIRERVCAGLEKARASGKRRRGLPC